MKAPNAERAIVEIEKLRDYFLSENHPRGKRKARVFASALGITVDDAAELRSAMLVAPYVLQKQFQEKTTSLVKGISLIFQ